MFLWSFVLRFNSAASFTKQDFESMDSTLFFLFSYRDYRYTDPKYRNPISFLFRKVSTQNPWRNCYGFGPGEPGAPNPNGSNRGPQAQSVEQKHWPGRPLICYNVVFWPSEFCKVSLQSPGSGISETLDSKISGWACPGPHRKLVHARRSTRSTALNSGTYTRGPSKILNQGPPDITLRHWLKLWQLWFLFCLSFQTCWDFKARCHFVPFWSNFGAKLWS
jgi:hypothetical protein